MKVIHFQIEDTLHKKMRLKALEKDKSLKQYVTDLIKKDVESKKEQTH